jgi:hypothetical protein
MGLPAPTHHKCEKQVNPKHQNVLPQGAEIKQTESTLTTHDCEGLTKVF